MKKSYYHGYVTANDKWFYWRDILSLMRMRKLNPGIPRISLFIIISEAKKQTKRDSFFIQALPKLFQDHPFIDLQEVIVRNNLGRDFGSYGLFANKIKQLAAAEDVILFQNRSAYGPFTSDWYLKFNEQLQQYPHTALCGATVNFSDHPDRSQENNKAHVQTYVFATQKKYLDQLGESFPAERESERLQIILQGEIGLSQRLLQQGYQITCLEFPQQVINASTAAFIHEDVKQKVKESHPFYHRSYFRGRKIFKLYQLKYIFQFFWIALQPTKANH